MLSAWYCMRGLRPMSPRTRTWTVVLGSLGPSCSVLRFGTYCDGNRRMRIVSAVETQTAMVMRESIMMDRARKKDQPLDDDGDGIYVTYQFGA